MNVGDSRTLLVVAVYRSEFQHPELDQPPFTRQYSMRPTGEREQEPIDVAAIASCLHHLLKTDRDEFDCRTSRSADVVHLEHIRTLRDHLTRGPIDVLLIGSGPSARGDCGTFPLAELFGTVAQRELGGRLRQLRIHTINFEDAIRPSSTPELLDHRSIRELLDELAGPGGMDSAPWDHCYLSIRGPASERLAKTFGYLVPAAVPLSSIDRRSDHEPPLTEPVNRDLTIDSRLARELMTTWSRAERLDAVRVAELVLDETKALLARRSPLHDQNELQALLDQADTDG